MLKPLMRRYFSILKESKEPVQFRLSKVIADTGLCSRREAEKWIFEGRVKINENKVSSPAMILTANDKVFLDDQLVSSNMLHPSRDSETPKLWAVSKLKGELVAHRDDNRQRPLLFDRLHVLAPSSTLRPIIYQGFNVEGLCLVTNNPQLARVLGDRESGLLKYYRVRLNGVVSESKIEGLKRGMFISNVRQPSIQLKVESTSNTMSWAMLSTQENSSKVIKTCLEHMHLNVTRMICVGFGPYKLSKLESGQAQVLTLTPEIVSLLRKSSRL